MLLQTLAASATALLPNFGRGAGARAATRIQFRFGPAIFAGALTSALMHWRLA